MLFQKLKEIYNPYISSELWLIFDYPLDKGWIATIEIFQRFSDNDIEIDAYESYEDLESWEPFNTDIIDMSDVEDEITQEQLEAKIEYISILLSELWKD